jgi:hypothetical protein
VKPGCAVAIVLEDAIALQRVSHQAAIVVPTTDGFEALPLDQGIKVFTVFLPLGKTEWGPAARTFSQAARAAGAEVRIVVPVFGEFGAQENRFSEDGGERNLAASSRRYWWQRLKGASELKPQMMREVGAPDEK